jgi:hypothetical protein
MHERVDAPTHPKPGPGLSTGDKQVVNETFERRVFPEAGGKVHGKGGLAEAGNFAEIARFFAKKGTPPPSYSA